MPNERPQIGEGFSAVKGGQMLPGDREDRKKTLKKRMALGLAGTVVLLAGALYSFFGIFAPAYKEYKQLVQDEMRFKASQDQLSWKQFRRQADGNWTLVAEGVGAADWRAKGTLSERFPWGDVQGWSERERVQPWPLSERPHLTGKLTARVIRANGSIEDYEPLSNLIVNAGENYLVDAFQNSTEPENLRFHGIGIGAVAAAETDTGCGTELTTQYNPDSTRATGSLTEGASTNIFRTVGTNTVDAAVAITEFCLMSQAAVPGGTMWSRVVFSAINLASGDSLQTTYDLTVE